jgi:hypothetical protein
MDLIIIGMRAGATEQPTGHPRHHLRPCPNVENAETSQTHAGDLADTDYSDHGGTGPAGQPVDDMLPLRTLSTLVLSTPAQQWEREHRVRNTVRPRPPLHHRSGRDLLRSRLVARQDGGTRPVGGRCRCTRSTGATGSTGSRAGGARASRNHSSVVVDSLRLWFHRRHQEHQPRAGSLSTGASRAEGLPHSLETPTAE